jgi:bacterioferritin
MNGGAQMGFLKNIEEIRSRARKKIEEGAVTNDYKLDRGSSVAILNEALATEIVCVLRYRFHHVMATGIHSVPVAEEFLENAQDEQEHANQLAKRIKELGGKPEMNPAVVARASHTEFKEGASLVDMIREDLVAERIVIETYRQIVTYFGDKDPTSRRLIEDILSKEEEHADELADLLFAVSPENDLETRRLYFRDEITAAPDGGESQERSKHK